MTSVARVSANAAAKPPSKLGLATGDRIGFSKLLEAAIMGSCNDAATAIAEHIAGSESAFAKRMNDTARRLGAKESNFRNPHGLDAQGHYSTAYDIAILSRHALEVPTLAKIFTQQQVNFTWEGGHSVVANINSFLWRYKGAIGLKTGYTNDAGYSASAAARRDNHTIIVVLLGCPSSEARWNDATHLMDYAFENYQTLRTIASSAQTRTYTVKPGDTLYGIASRLGKSIAAILQANSGLAGHPDLLLPGQTIVIP